MNETSKDEYLNVKLCANEEYEVTDYSIRILQKKYNYLSSYTWHEYKRYRNQMTSSGAWLEPKRGSEKQVDVVGDILTSLKLLKDTKIDKEIERKYCAVYHAIGNIIPIPEGANYGGGLGSDNYFYKLSYIKDLFKRKDSGKEIVFKEEENSVKSRLNKGIALGARSREVDGVVFSAFTNKLMLRYWLMKESDIENWKAYVDSNFLLGNFVNDDYSIREFNFRKIDDNCINDLIKTIIKRSLQILGEDFSEDIIEKRYNEL